MDESDDLEDCRRWFAEELRWTAGVQSEVLVQAFASVPREQFLGPGPWKIVTPTHEYRQTPDDNPEHVYHNVLIAIDANRHLNNGLPGAWAGWLDQLDPLAGRQILHVGAGTGYYAAIMAQVAGQTGSVIAFEIDPDLAKRASHNLIPWPNVHVVAGDGAQFDTSDLDVIIASAGVAAIAPVWLNAVKPGGQILLPLTANEHTDAGGTTYGGMLRITRRRDSYAADFISRAAFYPCIGAQDSQAAGDLLDAFRSGDMRRVRSLRRDKHVRDDSCWLHRNQYCLSYNEPVRE